MRSPFLENVFFPISYQENTNQLKFVTTIFYFFTKKMEIIE